MALGIDTKYPAMNVDEIIEFLGGAVARDQVERENARRKAAYEADRLAPIVEHMGEPLPGGPLIVGEWYDVTPGGGFQPGRAWRVCRYLGKRTDRQANFWREGYTFHTSYDFERWGAKWAGPYARPQVDSVGISSRGFAVERITPDPKLVEKAAK